MMKATYRVPLILAIVTAAGLMSALLGDGVWDAASWIVLSTPLAVIVWKYGWG